VISIFFFQDWLAQETTSCGIFQPLSSRVYIFALLFSSDYLFFGLLLFQPSDFTASAVFGHSLFLPRRAAAFLAGSESASLFSRHRLTLLFDIFDECKIVCLAISLVKHLLLACQASEAKLNQSFRKNRI